MEWTNKQSHHWLIYIHYYHYLLHLHLHIINTSPATTSHTSCFLRHPLPTPSASDHHHRNPFTPPHPLYHLQHLPISVHPNQSPPLFTPPPTPPALLRSCLHHHLYTVSSVSPWKQPEPKSKRRTDDSLVRHTQMLMILPAKSLWRSEMRIRLFRILINGRIMIGDFSGRIVLGHTRVVDRDLFITELMGIVAGIGKLISAGNHKYILEDQRL